MASITLAKALKIKNRLAGRLAKVQADIQRFNSILEGQDRPVNIAVLMELQAELVQTLVGLKTAINEANQAVQRDIYALAEKKATAQFLASIDTKHGPQPPAYPTTTVVSYAASLKKADVDSRLTRLEIEIDELQDKLDQFNVTQMIAVPERVIELCS
jgi:hypothetical protein